MIIRFYFKRHKVSYESLDALYSKEYSEILDYDLNGNITSLKRTGGLIGNTAEVMDNLVYHYNDGGNILSYLEETGSGNALSGYPLAQGNGQLISYDDNGNMTSHPDKGITKMTYNVLNLVSSITSPAASKSIAYVYASDGTKVKAASDGKVTDYLGGFQYETTLGNLTTQILANEEGYFDFINNRYVYQYKDHLGNIRLSYTKSANGGTELLEENNYYPLGLKHTNYNTGSTSNNNYKYLYNGKELQSSGYLDYGWRQYIPELGRWNGIDQLAESYHSFSPYAYVKNNPVSLTDPDGRMTYDWQLGAYRDNNGGLMGWSMNNVGDSSFGSNTNDSYSGRSSEEDVVSFISNFFGPGAANIILNFIRGDKNNLGNFVNSDFEANGWHVIDASSLADALIKLTKYLGNNQADNIYINAHGSTSKRYVLDENGQTIPDLESETGFKMMDDTGFHVGEEKILGTHLQQYISDKSKLSSDKLNSIESFIGIANYVKNGKNLIMGSCYSANDELFGKGLSSLVESRDIFVNRDFSSNYYVRGKGIIPFNNFINYNQTSQNNYEHGWVWYRNGSAVQTNFNIIMTKYGVKTIK